MEGSKTKFPYLRSLHFVSLEREIRNGEYVSIPRLVDIVRSRGDVPVPATVMDYMCLRLVDDPPVSRGPKARDPQDRWMHELSLTTMYEGLFEKIKNDKLGDIHGDLSPDHRDILKDKTRTPSEKAASIVADMFLDGPYSYRNALNIVSKVRRRLSSSHPK